MRIAPFAEWCTKCATEARGRGDPQSRVRRDSSDLDVQSATEVLAEAFELIVAGEVDHDLAATDGAVGSRRLKLEEIDHLKRQKAFVGRQRKSTYAITGAGRGGLLKSLEFWTLVHRDSKKSPIRRADANSIAASWVEC